MSAQLSQNEFSLDEKNLPQKNKRRCKSFESNRSDIRNGFSASEVFLTWKIASVVIFHSQPRLRFPWQLWGQSGKPKRCLWKRRVPRHPPTSKRCIWVAKRSVLFLCYLYLFFVIMLFCESVFLFRLDCFSTKLWRNLLTLFLWFPRLNDIPTACRNSMACNLAGSGKESAILCELRLYIAAWGVGNTKIRNKASILTKALRSPMPEVSLSSPRLHGLMFHWYQLNDLGHLEEDKSQGKHFRRRISISVSVLLCSSQLLAPNSQILSWFAQVQATFSCRCDGCKSQCTRGSTKIEDIRS